MNRFVIYMDGKDIALETELWKYGEGGELIHTLWIKILLVFDRYSPVWFTVHVETEPYLAHLLTEEDKAVITASFETDNILPRKVVFGEKVILID
jgi:hypothetical protein